MILLSLPSLRGRFAVLVLLLVALLVLALVYAAAVHPLLWHVVADAPTIISHSG